MADPIDIATGLKVRNRRRELRMSQDTLGKALGLSFQQVQKYERGANRISVSKLCEIAAALKVSPGDLIADVPREAGMVVHPEVSLDSPGAMRLLTAYGKIALPQTRQFVVKVLEQLADLANSKEPT